MIALVRSGPKAVRLCGQPAATESAPDPQLWAGELTAANRPALSETTANGQNGSAVDLIRAYRAVGHERVSLGTAVFGALVCLQRASSVPATACNE
jgi:hypothetical protein